MTQKPSTDVRYVVGPHVLHLPIGPVRKLTTGIGPSYNGTGRWLYWLNCPPLGQPQARVEIGRAHLNAKWLRPAMVTRSLGHLGYRLEAIGASLRRQFYPRWDTSPAHRLVPRFPSGIPSHPSGDNLKRAYRSRFFPWVGLALRKYNLENGQRIAWAASTSSFEVKGRYSAPGFDGATTTSDTTLNLNTWQKT